jgi:hypothetical protein
MDNRDTRAVLEYHVDLHLVTEFFSPHAAGKSAMFLVALGHPDRAALGLAP